MPKAGYDADALIRCFAGTLIRWCAGTLIRWCAGNLVLIGATCVNPTVVFHIRTVFKWSNVEHRFFRTCPLRDPRKAFRERRQIGTTNSEEEWDIAEPKSCRKTRVTSSKAGCLAGEDHDLRIKTSHTGHHWPSSLPLAWPYKESSKPANTSAKLRRLKCNRKKIQTTHGVWEFDTGNWQCFLKNIEMTCFSSSCLQRVFALHGRARRLLFVPILRQYSSSLRFGSSLLGSPLKFLGKSNMCNFYLWNSPLYTNWKHQDLHALAEKHLRSVVFSPLPIIKSWRHLLFQLSLIFSDFFCLAESQTLLWQGIDTEKHGNLFIPWIYGFFVFFARISVHILQTYSNWMFIHVQGGLRGTFRTSSWHLRWHRKQHSLSFKQLPCFMPCTYHLVKPYGNFLPLRSTYLPSGLFSDSNALLEDSNSVPLSNIVQLKLWEQRRVKSRSGIDD